MPKIPKTAKPGSRRRLLTVLVLAAAALAVLAAYLFFRNDLLFLKGGEVIAARRSWTLEDKVFHESGGSVQMLDAKTVLFRSEAFRLSAADLRLRLETVVRASLQGLSGIRKGAGSDLATSAAAALIAAALMAAAVATVAAAALKPRRKTAETRQDPPAEPRKTGPADPASPRLVRRSDVVRYFFRLYRMQLRAPAEAPGKIEALDPDPGTPGRRFRLGIRIDEDWKWRYMTIRTIGEETGSKSQCFYVIYDTHIVVKIPPVPIRDFSEYIQRIQIEAEIVRALSPRKCIIPNVSVILSRVHRFSDAELRSPEQLEDDYIRLLQQRPGLHHCLKIDNEFAFFMDLSRDHFLSHAMAGPAGDSLKSVMAEDAGLLADCRGFEVRYGADKGWICLELQRLYERFETELKNDLPNVAAAEIPPDPQKQQWFHRHLCDPAAPLSGGAPSVLTAAAEVLSRILPSRQEAVDEYRRLAVPHARKISFERTRPMKSAICENLLDLLAWLERRRVAIRDLKPDNLLVSGDATRYPTFLASAKEFSIGLIDLETAVICPEPGKEDYRQPQLGGTPTYATPSHFLPNRLLERCYRDLEPVFFLQDWYAVIGIIFAVATGRRLFTESAGLIPGMIGAMTEASRKKADLSEVFSRHNVQFWETARSEFDAKAKTYSVLLRSTSVQVPEAVAQSLTVFFHREGSALSKRICAALEEQNTLRNPKLRKELSTCSHRALVRAMENTQNGDASGAEPLQGLFARLSELKRRQERVARLRGRLEKGGSRLPVEDLLQLMFERVWRVLSNVKAEPRPGEVKPLPAVVSGDLDLDAKLSYTHTADL